MSKISELLNIATSQLGVREKPPGSNRVKYWDWYDPRFQGQPWCACFVSWCFAQAGIPLQITTVKGFIYVPAAVSWAKSRGYWSSHPKVGALACYQFDRDIQADHVGIVESFGGGAITAVEGNTSAGSGGSQSDGGGVYRRVRSLSQVSGFIYPPILDERMAPVAQTAIKGPILHGILQPWLCHSDLDNEGRGYQDIGGLPKDRVLGSPLLNGANPAQGGHKPIVEFSCLNIAGLTRVVFEGGIPNGAIDYTVWQVL